MDPALLDNIIARLLEVKSLKPGKNAQLSESEIKQLCAASKEIFLAQPNLLELEAPIKICGNTSIPPSIHPPLPPRAGRPRNAISGDRSRWSTRGRWLLCHVFFFGAGEFGRDSSSAVALLW